MAYGGDRLSQGISPELPAEELVAVYAKFIVAAAYGNMPASVVAKIAREIGPLAHDRVQVLARQHLPAEKLGTSGTIPGV